MQQLKPRACSVVNILQEDEASSKERRHPPTWAYVRSLAWVRPVLILAALYLLALATILALFSQLPSLSQMAERHAAGGGGVAERLQLAVPHSFDELRAVRRTLELYRRNYGLLVALLLVATHVFLQVGSPTPAVEEDTEASIATAAVGTLQTVAGAAWAVAAALPGTATYCLLPHCLPAGLYDSRLHPGQHPGRQHVHTAR